MKTHVGISNSGVHMKHKKKVTPAVLNANQANSKSSTGPTSKQGKANSRRNAKTHGILATKLVFETEEQRKEFEELLQACRKDRAPQGLLEEGLVEEIAIVFWKLGITEGFVAKDLLRRQDLDDDLGGIFSKDIHLPISSWDLPLDRGWECERIVVRAVGRTDSSSASASRGPAVFQNQVITAIQKTNGDNHQKAKHLEVEAVLGSTFDKMTRYQSALKRDLYRTIDMLCKLQAERKDRESKA
jgi:hypothetical protein